MTAPLVTLTFDNGPTPGITEPLLDILGSHHVPAIFFAIGRKLITQQGAVLGRRIVTEGHRLGVSRRRYRHDVVAGLSRRVRTDP